MESPACLEPGTTKGIERLIEYSNETRGVTIIWITHHLDQARTVGHYTWIMMEGEVVETGESQLLTSPKTEKAKRFIEGGLT